MSGFLGKVILVLLGAAISLFTQWITSQLNRDTYISNRIFEYRLKAINAIWSRFNDLLWKVGRSLALGFNTWTDQHLEETEELRREFNKELEAKQILLDRNVVEAFNQLNTDVMLFSHGDLRNDEGNPISYPQFLEDRIYPHREELAAAINDTINETTHEISLEFGHSDA